MLRKVLRIVAVLCLGFFVYMVFKIGPGEIWEAIRRVSWKGMIILFLYRIIYFMIRSLNWKTILIRMGSRISLRHIFAVRLVSHAVGYLTPANKVGGEAIRIVVIEGVDRKKATASVVVDKTIEWLSATILIILGVILAVFRVSLSPGVQWMIISMTVLGLAAVLFLIFIQRKGMLVRAIKLLEKMKIRIKLIDRYRDKIEETDRHISEFYTLQPKIFFAVFIGYIILFLIWTVELKLTLTFLGAPNISFVDCYILATFGAVALSIPALPASLGIFEASIISVTALLGFPDDISGAMIIVRRIIGLLWAGVGMFLLTRMKKLSSQSKKNSASIQ